MQLPSVGALTVKSRVGGELLKMGDPAFHKSVKKMLQESSLPPWERDRIPLIYSEDRLVCVWGLAISVDFQNAAARTASELADGSAKGTRFDQTRA